MGGCRIPKVLHPAPAGIEGTGLEEQLGLVGCSNDQKKNSIALKAELATLTTRLRSISVLGLSTLLRDDEVTLCF